VHFVGDGKKIDKNDLAAYPGLDPLPTGPAN
jgi:hypothetical protein